MGKKAKTPKTPDYAALAQQTAAGNYDVAQATQAGNMVNQITPDGNVNFTRQEVGKTSAGQPIYQWTQKVELSPAQQLAYDKDNQMNAGLQDVGIRGVGFVNQALDKPLSFDGMYGLKDPGQIQKEASDAAYKNAMRYAEPRLQRDQSRLENQLANQGITRGSEAWNAAMSDENARQQNIYDNAQNQAYIQGLQGASQAYTQGLGNRQQQISEAEQLQHEPINILNAVRTGSQLQSAQQPQISPSQAAQMQYVGGADLLGAGQMQYQSALDKANAKNAMFGNTMNGLFGLGQAKILA